MAYIYSLVDTWNASGTTFTGIGLNVTDTASAAGSLLMDLQVGGVSRFRVDKNEGVYLRTNSKAIEIADPYGFRMTTGTDFDFTINTAVSMSMRPGLLGVSSLCFGRSTGYLTTLEQDGNTTHALAQRNGVNAQAFNLYNTYTDASNYERGFMRFVSNVLEIGAEKLGTGTVRNVKIYQNFDKQVIISAGGWDFWHGNGSSTGFGLYPYEARHGSTTIGFSAGNSSTASDAGIARTAAAQLKVTNGSTGTGQLIFIVPTTNPGITGALWNNAGTLAIS